MMNKIWLALLVCFSLSASASELKIFSWNVFMLPQPVKYSLQSVRKLMIAGELGQLDHDVIILQEAFWGPFRAAVSSQLKHDYPYQARLGRRTVLKEVMSSGLMVLSRHPFKILGHRYFNTCRIADCFASKGVMLIELNLQGSPLQLALTHMQAGKGLIFEQVRRNQLATIKGLLKHHRTIAVPQLLVGDLNIDELSGDEYKKSLESLKMTSAPLSGSIYSSKAPATNCYEKQNSTSPSMVDHLLLNQNDSNVSISQKELKHLRGNFGGRLCDLSDHLPLSTTLEF